MKRILSLIIISNLFILSIFGINKETVKRIKKYSGNHKTELIKLLNDSNPEIAKYAEFILSNSSSNDLATVRAEYLKNNIKMAIKARNLPFNNYSEEIFKHFVLPYRASQEPIEDWRSKFYEEIYPIVKDAKSIEEAAILINLWANEKMTFKPTHGRDQAALTTIKRGYGRCEEMMIIFIDAARSVGIPVRATSAPYWNFTDNNHAWVEIWTPDGWKYRGEPENSLNNSWFTKTTRRATIVESQAFGKFNTPDLIKYKNRASTINSTKYYNDPKKCVIKIVNKRNKPIKNADVNFYAVSWGGIFPFLNLKTDKFGQAKIDLGKGSVYITSKKNKLFGSSTFNNMKSDSITITINKSFEINNNTNILFPLQDNSPNPNAKKQILGEKFKYLKELSNLRRDKRLHSYLKPLYFVNFFDKIHSDKSDKNYEKKRQEFVEKSNLIEGNISQFMYVIDKYEDNKDKEKILFDMINEWDTKELVEIPDSTNIEKVMNIYFDAKRHFSKSIPDSVFSKYVIGFTWRSFTPPQNGWQEEFLSTIKNLQTDTIETTKENIVKFFDKNLKIDKNFKYSYFSGTLNPVQIMRLHYIPQSYKLKTVNCALKLLGVPIRWKGRLEYFNENKWLPVYKKKKDEEKYKGFILSIFIDGKQVKAEPWKNFLIGELSKDDGQISNTYFDGENDSLNYVGKYLYNGNPVYLEGVVRNINGDANLIVKSIKNSKDSTYVLNLKTPEEYVNEATNISENLRNKLFSFSKDGSKTIVFVAGNQITEPIQRMYNQMIAASEKINKKDIKVIVLTSKDNLMDAKNKLSKIKVIKDWDGMEEINNYPAIYLISNNEIKFASEGFNLGVIDLILKK